MTPHMPVRFADRPPRLPAPNPSVGRPVILEVDEFADVTISPADLTVTERSVLLVLMAESRPVPNPDLVAFGPKLDKPGRDKLNKLGLIESQRSGRAIRSRAHRSRLAALPRHSGRRPASPICNASVSSVDLVGQAVQLGRPSRTAKAVACPRHRTSVELAADAPERATRTTVRAARRWTVS